MILRALIVDLEEWVKNGTPPPNSRVPRIADGTLVPPAEIAFPTIPGVTFAGLYNGSGERDFERKLAFEVQPTLTQCYTATEREQTNLDAALFVNVFSIFRRTLAAHNGLVAGFPYPRPCRINASRFGAVPPR